jgi:3-methyladenine DNA glycosylase/8-oxoguanine DNA glycosylase
MIIKLEARPPFCLRPVVKSHGWVALAPYAWDEEAGRLSYTIRLDSGRVVELRISRAVGGVGVEAGEVLADDEQQQVARDVGWMLGLDQEFAAFYELARGEAKLALAKEQCQGRILRSPTLFEDTVKTILTTNTAWSGTMRMAGALVSKFGSPLAADAARHAFPTADQLAAAGEQLLRSEAGLGYRAPYVLALAEAVATGELDLEGLKTAGMPTEQLRKRLLAIKGVGAYAAANLLMLLGRYDFVPVDSWALKVVSHEWYGGRPIDASEVEEAFARWGEWKGLAYWFWSWSYFEEV